MSTLAERRKLAKMAKFAVILGMEVREGEEVLVKETWRAGVLIKAEVLEKKK